MLERILIIKKDVQDVERVFGNAQNSALHGI